MQVANFNVVFGEQERPMLDFFDTIVFPSFTSGIKKSVNEDEYLFKNIKISKPYSQNYLLTGQIVRKTILEIKSDLNAEGNLVEMDEKYSAAPYSSFVINLLNHRMLFLPNQKGSPTLANFRSTVKHVINVYLSSNIANLGYDKKSVRAYINVVGIPSAQSMDELLNNVKKVSSLTLKFYPLNGDLDFSDAFDIFTQNVRNEVDCKTGSIVLNSPKSINGIKKLIELAAGTIEPVIKAITADNSKVTLKDSELSEKYDIELDKGKGPQEETNILVHQIPKIKTLTYSNENHQKIYERNKDKIISVIEKR